MTSRRPAVIIVSILALVFSIGCSVPPDTSNSSLERVPGIVSLSLQAGTSNLSCQRLTAEDDAHNVLIDADISALALVGGRGAFHASLPIGNHHLTATLTCEDDGGVPVELAGTAANVQVEHGATWTAAFWFVLDLDTSLAQGLVEAGFCPAVSIAQAPAAICVGTPTISVDVVSTQPVDATACPLEVALTVDSATTSHLTATGESDWRLTVDAPQTPGSYAISLTASVGAGYALPTGDELPLEVVDCGVPTPPVQTCELLDTGATVLIGCPELSQDGTVLSFVTGVYSDTPAAMANFTFSTDTSIVTFNATPQASLVDMGLGDSGSFLTASPADGAFSVLVTPEILQGETLDPIPLDTVWFKIEMTLDAATPAVIPVAVTGVITTIDGGTTTDLPFTASTSFDLSGL